MIISSRLRRFAVSALHGKSAAFAVVQTILTQALIVALNMGSGILTARLLGAEGRGVFTAVTVWPLFLSYAASFGLPSALVYCLRALPTDRSRILAAAFLLGGIFSTFAVVVGMAAAPPTLTKFPAGTTLLALLCILGTYPQFFNTLLRQALVGVGLFRAFNVSGLLAPALYFAAMLVVWAGFGLTPSSCAACLLVTLLATDLWMLANLMTHTRPTFKGIAPALRQLSSYAGRASVSDLLSGLTSNIDRLVLISFIPPAELGRYAVAYSFSRLIQLPQVGVIMVLFPVMTGRPRAEIKSLHDHALRFTLYGVGIMLLGALMLGPWLLGELYGRQFRDLGTLCSLLFIEASIGGIATVITQLYMSVGNPGFTSGAQAIGFLVLCGGMALLVPTAGAKGAAIAMLVASLVRLAVLAAGIPVWLRLSAPRLRLVGADLAFLRQRLGG